jgi:hypothetical protein
MRETIRGTLRPGQCVTIAGRRICNRWTKNTSTSTQDYINGIKKPKRPWGKATCEAANSYKAGVDAGHARGSFAKGVKKRGAAGWLTRTLLKGPTRFAQGVAGAGDSYARGYAPYHSHFPGIQMGPRFRRGDPRNINRCSAVSAAFGRIKVGKATTGKVTCPDR